MVTIRLKHLHSYVWAEFWPKAAVDVKSAEELVAERVYLKAVGLRQLADRLAQDLGALGGVRRGAPARHQTLQAAIERTLGSVATGWARTLTRLQR